MQASELIDAAAKELNDVNHDTWSEVSLIGFLNAGQREVVKVRPSACSVVEEVELIAGTLQYIPATYHALMAVIRNTDGGGDPGEAITKVDKESLDLSNLLWHSDAVSTSVEHYAYDVEKPDVYFVTPPADFGIFIECAFYIHPVDVGSAFDEIGLEAIYANAILQWMLYRAYSVETDSMSSQQSSQSNYSAFYNSMGESLPIAPVVSAGGGGF